MATSGSFSSSSYNSAGYTFIWSSTGSGLTSTISWTVKYYCGAQRQRPYSCFFEVSGYNGGTPSISSYTVLPAGSYPSGTQYPYNDTVLATGSFTVTHNSSAKGGFTVRLHGGVYEHGDYVVDGTANFALDDLYTNCSAPTSVSVSSSIVVPNATLTVSWSGASGGTNNSISSYTVFRSINGGDYVQLSGDVTTASKSVTVAATRGDTYTFKVRANGIYNSPTSTATASTKINTLPAKPTVSVDKTNVPSTNGTVKFTVSSSDSNGQSVALYYNTNGSTTRTQFTSPLSLTVSATTTYYFWAYDGLEYSSSYTSKTITKNVKPVISSVTTTAANIHTYTALSSDGVSGSRLGWADKIKPTINATKTGTVTMTPEFIDSDGTASFPSSGFLTWTNQTFALTSAGTNVDMDEYNFGSIVGSYGFQISNWERCVQWRMKFILNDGIENSDPVYFPANNQYYAIAKRTSDLIKYNQFAASNIAGTTDGHMWKRVRIYYEKDTSVGQSTSTILPTVTCNNITEPTTFTYGTSNEYDYIDLTMVNDNLASGAIINFSIKLSTTDGTIFKTLTTSMTEVLTPTLSSLNHDGSIIKPFTDTGNFTVSVPWPFGASTTLSSGLSAYDCSTTATNAIKIKHATSSSGANIIDISQTPSWTKSNDLLQTSIAKNTLYGWNNSLSITSYVGTKTYYAALQITNLFGKVYSTSWLQRTFNFNELAIVSSISQMKYNMTGASGSWSTFTFGSGNNKIQEGMYLQFTIPFNTYTADTCTVELQLTNSSGTNTVATTSVTSQAATNRTSKSQTITIIYGPVSELTDTNQRQWRYKITNNAGVSTSNQIITDPLKQGPPTLTLNSASVDDNYILTYNFTLSNNGLASGIGSLTNVFYNDDSGAMGGTISGTGTISGSQQLTTIGWDVKVIKIRSTSSISAGSNGVLVSSTKYYYSNALMVYYVSPTVAYRKNSIGINTLNPDNSAILDIHPQSGKNIILIQGDANAFLLKINTTTADIQLLEGNTIVHTLNLKNGTLI